MIRKLYSRKDTVLGMLVYPDEWEHTLKERGHFSFAYRSMDDLLAEFSPSSVAIPTSATMRRIVIHRTDWIDRHGVQLIGCTPEEFEKIPRCGFLPGAGYLRSMVE